MNEQEVVRVLTRLSSLSGQLGTMGRENDKSMVLIRLSWLAAVGKAIQDCIATLTEELFEKEK